ncbi:hypothetical protein E3Q17_03508 [Wallemia mellicola]|uniref:F-box domain-containing protein n=1 Tax=Wallemia mellicola TaxID=1708541 RepID=A0A4T0NJF2_9BASI|nr:hypothetical protein E3Q17_03508 [Wallemia mellicola]
MKNGLILDKLPNELIIDIIMLLPINDLSQLACVCRTLNDVIKKHRNLIYHTKSIEYGFTDIHSDIDNVYSVANKRRCLRKTFEKVNDWRDYCFLSLQQNERWPSQCNDSRGIDLHLPRDRSVWRVKVDTNLKIFIYTSTMGGLSIKSIENPHEFRCCNTSVAPFAHLEYDNGYASTHGASLDLWKIRLEGNLPKLEHITRVSVPFETRASRMKFGVLAVASADGAHIALINPSDGSLIKVINTVRVVLGVPLMIFYIEQTPNEVLICRGSKIEVYSKQTGLLCTTIRITINPDQFYCLSKVQFGGLQGDEPVSGIAPTFQEFQIAKRHEIDEDEDNLTAQVRADMFAYFGINRPAANNEDQANIVQENPVELDDERDNPVGEDVEERDLVQALMHEFEDNWSAVHVDGDTLVALSEKQILIVPNYSKAIEDDEMLNKQMVIKLPEYDGDTSQMCFEYSRMVFELEGHLCILPLHDTPQVMYISESAAPDSASAMQATEDAIISTIHENDNHSHWPHIQTIRWIDFSPTSATLSN